jgi:hypothetical protein
MRIVKKQWILFSVILAACLVAGMIRFSSLNSEIRNSYVQFRKLVDQDDYESAYKMMSDEYRFHNDIERFRVYFQKGDMFKLQGKGVVRNNCLGRGSLYPFEDSLFELWNGSQYHFIKEGRSWHLTGRIDQYTD